MGVGLNHVLTKEMSKATTERREVGFQMPKKLPKRNHVRLVVGIAFDSQLFFLLEVILHLGRFRLAGGGSMPRRPCKKKRPTKMGGTLIRLDLFFLKESYSMHGSQVNCTYLGLFYLIYN